MKQSTFIILGIIVILVLVGAWAYLLFSGTPKDANQIFTDLGLGGEEDSGVVIAPEPVVEEPVVNMDRPRLRQLTTKPVIGFTEVRATTSDPVVVYYAEAGTGNVYTIRLDSGEETRVSNTTVPEASYASFSPLGDAVAIRSHNDKRVSELIVGTFDKGTGGLKTMTFAPTVSDFSLVSSSSLLYTVPSPSGLLAREYNFTKSTDTAIFTVPFNEARILWGTSSAATHLAYPKPTYLLEGYLYSYKKGAMMRLPASGYGLSAFLAGDSIIYTTTSNYTPKSTGLNEKLGTSQPLSIITLPEKCTSSLISTSTLWCGYELKKSTFEFPDTWYRGEVSFKDSLWLVDLELGSAELLVDTFIASGRELDVTDLKVGPSESALYFINKNDNTLWMYEL
jgi:hypothetical protein